MRESWPLINSSRSASSMERDQYSNRLTVGLHSFCRSMHSICFSHAWLGTVQVRCNSGKRSIKAPSTSILTAAVWRSGRQSILPKSAADHQGPTFLMDRVMDEVWHTTLQVFERPWKVWKSVMVVSCSSLGICFIGRGETSMHTKQLTW